MIKEKLGFIFSLTFLSVVLLTALGWLLAGGYTAWRLTALTGKALNWDFECSLLQQWCIVISRDHPTQILLGFITATIVFCYFYGKYDDRKYIAFCKRRRIEALIRHGRAAYWRARL